MARYDRVGTHRTTVGAQNGTIVITYHTTPVVAFDDKTITLNTGGWATVTTKLRMNQASNQFDLGYQVYAKNYYWFVDFKGETIPFDTRILTLNR
jgi:hypothetical protein